MVWVIQKLQSKAFGICLVVLLFCFSLCGYICLDDGMKGAKDKNKRQGGSKADNEFFSP